MKNQVFRENLICNPFWFAARFISIPIAMVAYGEIRVCSTVSEGFAADRTESCAKADHPDFIMSLAAPMLLDFGLVQFVAVYASR